MQQAQSSRSQGGIHWENTKPGRERVVWFSFRFLLFFMILGILVPVLANPTGLQALFTGIQTTGLVTGAGASGRCHSFTFTFVDNHNQVQHITDPSLCLNGFVSYGDHVTIWYQQDHPSQMMTASELNFDLIFFLGFSSPMLLFLAFRCVPFVRGPVKHLRQVKQRTTEDAYRQ